jgi:hypothetical protein
MTEFTIGRKRIGTSFWTRFAQSCQTVVITTAASIAEQLRARENHFERADLVGRRALVRLKSACGPST